MGLLGASRFIPPGKLIPCCVGTEITFRKARLLTVINALMRIEYRVVDDPDELKEIVDLEAVVWSMPLSEAVPHNMLFAVIHSGGVVLRADSDGELVGFALGLVALRGEEPILWSHLAGVVPMRQGQGIGVGVKQAQRRWALEHGFKIIAWTYDPLQRGNANFNLHLL